LIAITDTHTLIWHDANTPRASTALRRYLRDPGWTVYVSVVNPWEMTIKTQTGKLILRADVPAIIADVLAFNPIQLLPVTYDHILALGRLPPVHKDPFDRLLAAQAIAENGVLVTDDPIFQHYPVHTDW
jgi:PIN domain nuclease of toxin-antitoxin system